MMGATMHLSNSFTTTSFSPLLAKTASGKFKMESLHVSTTSQDDSSTMTAQERIIKEALGIEPETAAEREERIKQREQQANASKNKKRNNIFVAILAFSAAILNYGYQFTHPITSLSLLAEMQRNSEELNVIGNNGKPTMVEFWAPWCINCREEAATIASIEAEYKGKVNFIMVDGDKGDNWPIIERFNVDAIPHIALVSSDGLVETSLIGTIPRGVLRDDLDTMIENSHRLEQGEGRKQLPYVMYDSFQNRPENRQLTFSKDQPPPIRLGSK